MKKMIYRFLEKVLTKNWKIRNKSYEFRKWFYLKVLKLEVCHFCLKEYEKGGRRYCWDCMEETL